MPTPSSCKGALIDIAAHAAAADAEALRAELAARGLTEVHGAHRRRDHHPSVWGARPDAAPEDVLVTWQQLVALHRQWHSLTKELKDAEQALGQDTSEANYLRLRDVKARLSAHRWNRGPDRGLRSLFRPRRP